MTPLVILYWRKTSSFRTGSVINIVLIALLAYANFKVNLARIKIEYLNKKSLIDQGHKDRLIDKLIEERSGYNYLASASYLGEMK